MVLKVAIVKYLVIIRLLENLPGTENSSHHTYRIDLLLLLSLMLPLASTRNLHFSRK